MSGVRATETWLAQKATNTDGSASTNVSSENTPSFAQRMASRFGTAVKLARIIPVEYSAVIVSTASTAIASCDRFTPAVAISSGCRFARSRGLIVPQCDEVTAANRHGRPIVSATATRSDQRVERTERIFVHSDTATRSCVTRPVCGSGGSICTELIRRPPRRPTRGTRRPRA